MDTSSAARPGRGRRLSTLALATTASIAVAAAMTGPATGSTSTASGSSGSSTAGRDVVPVDWSRFSAELPAGDAPETMRHVLLNATKYAVGTWYPATFGADDGEYLDLGGIGEHQIRPVASEALTLAATLRTGVYDPQATGVPPAEAERITLRLIESLAFRHRANSGETGWGDHWQSALWAYWAGSAGWFMWDDLDDDAREQVRAMVEHEADRFVGYEVPYYRDAVGDIVSPGDTKAEENAWNGLVLQLATAMMPEHENWTRWMSKVVELMISAYARPQDVDSAQRLHGRTVAQWLNGSNADEDATVINHGILHPEYQTPITFNVAAVQSYTLAGMPTPRAAFFNVAEVYRSLVDLEFPSPPYDAPGGTVYVDGSSDIYYPQGSDWGPSRRMIYAWLDTQAAVHGLDGQASTGAASWAALHTGKVLEMQSRFEDGRTFAGPEEFDYPGREQFVAVQAAQAYLVHWIDHQGGFRLTDRPYRLRPADTAAGRLTLDLPDRLVPGQAAEVDAVFRNNTDLPLTRLEIAPEPPAGWKVTPSTVAAARILPGATTTATFDVTPPPTAAPGTITATARFRLAGEQRQVEAAPKGAPLWASPDGALFMLGEPDESSHEFALAPAGNAGFLQRFPDGVEVDAAAPDAAANWSYIQPGPRDRWAGSRSHPFGLTFDLDELPAEQLILTAWLVDTQHSVPPLVEIALNGEAVASVRLPRGGGDGYHWGDGTPDAYGGVRPTSVSVALPANALRAGANTVHLTSVDGSWLVYDALAVQQID